MYFIQTLTAQSAGTEEYEYCFSIKEQDLLQLCPGYDTKPSNV